MNNKLVRKFAKAIEKAALEYPEPPERGAQFANKCALTAVRIYGINAASSTEETCAFQKAYDNYFN
jgi:hypothetical protein